VRAVPHTCGKADVGDTKIVAIEQLLSTRYAALRAYLTSVLLRMEHENELRRRNDL
jgi:hypothetical protein